MASQYEKRKAKVAELEELAEKHMQKAAEVISKEPAFTQTGLDIYTTDGKNYGVAEIAYNPETGEAKVIGTFSITRLVALTYDQQKTALRTLKQRKK